MYTMSACGEQPGFVFIPSASCTCLSRWAQMFHTQTQTSLLFCLGCWCSVGPKVFAFSPSVLCVNLCYYMSELLFLFICSTERLEGFSETQTQKPKVKSGKRKKKKQRRKWYAALQRSCNQWISTGTCNKNPLTEKPNYKSHSNILRK